MLAAGTAIQRYVVEAPIGVGGMGSVYRARDTHLDRAVALKVLSDGAGGVPDREARERLVREARAAAALSHPNAVAIYDAGDSEHGPFIVMELVEGDTLRSAMDRRPSVAEILSWMKMAALALGEAHDRGIVHRDIKPENLMVRRDGIAKVLDFGIARAGAHGLDASSPTQAALPTLTGTGVQIGTPQYMAPEQIKGKKLDGRTDQFAWAVTTFEALAGELPWHAENGALGVVASILEEVPADLSTLREGVPEHVGRAIARAMSKRPEDRFAKMGDLVRALDGLPVEEPPSPAVPPRQTAPRPTPKNETRFSEATMKAVIGKALVFQEQGGYSRSELEEAALELGISSDALAEATNAIRRDKQASVVAHNEDAIRARIIAKRRRSFQKHFVVYLGVNLIIAMPALMKDMHGKIAALFVPAIAWGIALAMHAMRAFSRDVSAEEIREEIAREEKAIAKDASRRAALAKRLDKHARRDAMRRGAAELGGAVEEGVASILSAAAAKIRDGASAAQKQQDARVRVAEATPKRDTARERAEAEAEADAAGGETARRVRRGR